MSKPVKVNAQVPSFFSFLALLFITLKLTGHITWSWWWVLAPLWIPAILIFCIMVFAVIVAVKMNK